MSVSVCPECLSHGVPPKCVYLEIPASRRATFLAPPPSIIVVLEFLPRLFLDILCTIGYPAAPPTLEGPICSQPYPVVPLRRIPTPRRKRKLTVLTSRVIRHNYRSARFAK